MYFTLTSEKINKYICLKCSLNKMFEKWQKTPFYQNSFKRPLEAKEIFKLDNHFHRMTNIEKYGLSKKHAKL